MTKTTKTTEILKRDFIDACLSLALDKKENKYIREDALVHAFSVNADGGNQLALRGKDLPAITENVNLPVSAVKNMVELAYTAILKNLGRGDTVNVLKNAINHLSDHELQLEWKAICDGTVTNIVETLLSIGDRPDLQKDVVNLFEGLAVPYFKQYKGNVPKEDLEWAHQQVKEFFETIKDKAYKGPKNLPQSKKSIKLIGK